MSKELPAGWHQIKFTEILDISGGTQPPKSEFIFEPQKGYIRLLQIRDFGAKPVPTYIPDNGKRKTCTKEDILIGRYGASVGRICTGMEGAYNVALAKVIKPRQINPGYIKYFLTSDLFQKPLSMLSRSAQDGFNKQDLAEFYFPVPPENEQIRIANKLDSLLAKVDAAQTRLEKIPTLLKRFRQAVLAAATSGELTQEWRETNSDLCFGNTDALAVKEIVDAHHVSECKKAERLGKRKPRHPHSNKKSADVEANLPAIPTQWLYQRLEDMSHGVSDGTHFTPKYVEKGIPFFSVKNVRPFKVSDENIKYISEEEYEEIDARCNSRVGDILYTKIGATYGYAAQNKIGYKHALYVSLALIKPVKEYFLSDYAEIIMNSELVFNQARNRVSGMGVPDLHLIEIRDFKVPIPHILEQKEIIRRTNSLYELAATVEKQYSEAKKRIDRLTQSLLAKAFRGELVPQDPNDEPASELLKRIQTERENKTEAKPKRIIKAKKK